MWNKTMSNKQAKGRGGLIFQRLPIKLSILMKEAIIGLNQGLSCFAVIFQRGRIGPAGQDGPSARNVVLFQQGVQAGP